MSDNQVSQDETIDIGRVAEFFDRFDAAFATFSGAEIAARYAEPYLACDADGSAEGFPTKVDIVGYFQKIVDTYHQLGVRLCSHSALAVRPLGGPHTIATLTWHLEDSDATELFTWSESYLLIDNGRDLLIRTGIVHPANGTGPL